VTSTGPRPLAFQASPLHRPRAGRERVSKTCFRGFDSFAACHAPGARVVEHRFRNRRSGFDSLQGLSKVQRAFSDIAYSNDSRATRPFKAGWPWLGSLAQG
jgi:hypothetical protein